MTDKPKMGRAPLPPQEKRIRVTVYLAPDVLRTIDEVAKDDEVTGRTIDRIVRQWSRAAALAALEDEAARRVCDAAGE